MLDQTSRPLRVAVLSSAGGGGGGIAAKRMADALDSQPDMQADFLSGEFFGGFLPPEVAPMISFSNRKLTDTHYTLEYPGYSRAWLVDFLAGYDVVNIHWASYLLGLAELDQLSRRGTRMLFMLHDFHYLTGGCHYPAGCTRMTMGCTNCPQFDDTLGDINFVPINLRIKQGLFARPNVHLAAPSKYLRDQAVTTGMVPESRAHVLRNAYVPVETDLPWPDDGTIRILVIADSLTERRKGMPLALESLNQLAARLESEQPGRPVVAHFVGAADEALKTALAQSRLAYHLHGRITDHAKLVEIFTLCDIVLSCSFEDNWPNILVEAGAYGCVPVVGPGHGCEEFARGYAIGAVTPDYEARSFATALLGVMAAVPDRATREANARRIRADHQPDLIASTFRSIADQMHQLVPSG